MKSASTTRLLFASFAVLALTAAWVGSARAAAPTLNQPANMTVNEGATADQVLVGSDPDGDALTFSKVSGPTFATVTTTTINPPRGNINLAPGFSDSGTAMVSILVSDGSLSDSKSLTVTVTQFNRAPVLTQPTNMSVEPGFTADQIVTGSDADGDALTFAKVSGPTFMTVTTTNATTGNVHLEPGLNESFGTSSATVSASDGALSDSKSFTIAVAQCHGAPVLAQPGNMTVNEGTTANQVIIAADACGIPLTFSKAAGPTFVTVTTISPGAGTATGNINLAPGFSDSGTATVTILVSDGSISDSKSLTVTVNNVTTPPRLAPIANMTVCGSTADQAISATDPDGDAIGFTFAGPSFMTLTSNAQVGNTRTGTIHLAPLQGAFGTFAATVTATANGESDTKSFTITVLASNLAPVLDQPANMTVDEGATADQTLRATDACPEQPLTFTGVSGPLFMFVTTTSPGAGTATGNIHLAPGFSAAGTYAAVVRVSDGSLTNDKAFTITVIEEHRCPVANAGGPYTGTVGAPVAFNGTASSDPDGDALSYAWDFDASDGITVDATGPTPSHAYAAAGSFTVTLTVTETASPFCSNAATTTVGIFPVCGATVFNGYDVIRLASGKPTWFAFVQPASGCYSNADVVLSSFVLKYAGRQIPADFSKGSVETDKNGDGIQEIRVSFSKQNLRTLFTGTGLGNGHNLVDVTIEASLVTGGALQGTTQVDVFNNGDFSAASISPNPLNPSATLTFTTARQGFARIELFDIAGRLVRTILDERTLAAGTHEVKIEGRGQRGETLASGIYFIRGVSADGTFTKAIAILK